MTIDALDGPPTTTAGTRRILAVASVLVFLVGIQLFVLTEATDRFFAWTIGSPLTAAFLGAAYWASFAMELAASRQRAWSHARIAVPAVLVFTAATFVVTLIHLEQFHLDDPRVLTRFLTWGWLVVYAVVPPLMLLILVRQVRAAAPDRPRRRPTPAWFRVLLSVHAVVMVPLGVALLVDPAGVASIWPWPLTPLTGRAVGAWSLGLGIAAAHAVWENDWSRIGAATASYLVFGVLELVAIARYPSELAWDTAGAWIYVGFLLSAALAGGYGWWHAHRVAV